MTFSEWSKKKRKEEEGLTFSEWHDQKYGVTREDVAPVANNDIAPVATKTEKADEKESGWFKGGLFADGYDFGDISRTLLGTVTDINENVHTAVFDATENLIDTVAHGVGVVGGMFSEDFQDDVGKFIAKDLLKSKDLGEIVELTTPTGLINRFVNGDAEEASLLGDKSDGLVQSAAHLVGQAALQYVGVPWWVTAGVNSFGSELESGLQQGATFDEATTSGAITAGAEILTEKISGGIKFGGKALDDVVTKKLSEGISNKVVKSLVKFGWDATGEGAEEILSGAISAVGQKITYADDKELNELFSSEDAFDAFIGGAVLGGGNSALNSVKNAQGGRDPVSGLTDNEKAVLDSVYNERVAEAEKNGKQLDSKEKNKIYDEVVEELQKGYISTDTIESVLGGDTYKSFKETVDGEDALIKEYEELRKMKKGEMNDIQQERLEELKAMNLTDTTKRDSLKAQLSDEVQQKLARNVKGKTQTDDFLIESYNERARRGVAFEADLSKYDEKQAKIIDNAVKSGILNNTRRTHEFVDMVAKISADKGVSFDFTDNAKLKETGFALDGKTINGYVTKDGITLNIESSKSLNSVVGHEIAHVLEGTELYNELQNALFEYAKTRNDYDGRYADLESLYKDVKDADINAELTADLIGDYLFTDEQFIKSLSAKNRNVFQKIYDEVKYLCKIATAGSKEARELEKVKRAFDKAYKESGKASGDTKYSLKEYTEHQKNNWKASKRIVVYENNEQLSQFIQDAVADNTSNKKMYFGAISSDLASRIQSDTGLDVENYNLSLGAYEIRKILKDHGDVNAEALRGQRVITTDDFSHIVDVVLNPTNIELSDKTYMGKPAIVFTGKHNGRMNVVAVVSDKRLDLFVQTLYANAKKENLSTPTGEQAPINTPEANSGTVFSKNILPQKGTNVNRKFSLSSDSDGKKLTKEQSEYFKDSKMRDENGNLKVMYHGSQDAGFHEFDANHSDDDTSLFFVDRNDVAASYSGTSETYEAQTIRTAEDMNNFIESIGVEGYEVVEKDGKFTLLYEGDRVADSNTAQGIYDEFCWYEGVGEGDANYKVYLNLTNPLEIDAKGRPWNKIDAEFSQEVYDKYNSLTAEEKAALTDLAEWEDFRIFNSEIQEARGNELASAYEKMGEDCNIYDLFSVAADSFSDEAMRENARKYLKTRDYAQRAKEQGYDGVIFKNLIDNGGYSNGSEGASTVAIAFESNQIKSVANEKPTGDPDIRYSLSEDSNGRELSEGQRSYFKESKVVDDNGNLKVMYHGTPNGDFTIFKDGTYFTENKLYADLYQNPGASSISTGKVASNPKTFEVYLDIKKPFDINDAEARSIYINDYIKGGNAVGINPYLSDAEYNKINTIDWTEGEDLREFLIDNGYDYDGLVLDEGATGGYGDDVKYRGKSYVVFSPEQVKNVDNLNPTDNPDIRYSLTEYTEAEKKAHNDAVKNHFGKTYSWNETGYLLLDGTKLDLSGKHDGAPGGYRTVDHRDITEALGYDYGGGDYSGSLVQFMSEGNIRIIPEIDGINLSVKPTKAQEQALTDYISRVRGEVVLDIDDLNGYTVVSMEYPRGTRSTKILNDIREWFDNGIKPENNLGYSLTKQGDTPKRYGKYNVYGKDLALETAPVAKTAPDNGTTSSEMEHVAPVQDTVQDVAASTPEDTLPEDFAPLSDDYSASVQAEIASLTEAKQSLESRLAEAVEKKDGDTVKALLAEYDGVLAKLNELEAQDRAQFESIDETEMPPEVEAPYYGDTEDIAPDDPFEERDIKVIGKPKYKAYMYENPEVKPFFQAEANVMLGELQSTTRGGRYYTSVEGGVPGAYGAESYGVWSGTKRQTSDDIAYLRDTVKMSYADIEKGLNAIIKDNGAENIAAAKKIEFVLNDRLMKGYQDFVYGMEVPPNQEYVNLLNEKQISEYSDEARKKFFEDIGATDIAPVAEQYEAIKPKPAADPTETVSYETTKKGQVEGQQTMFKESATPTKEQPIKTVKDRLVHQLNAAYGELSHNKRLRREAIESFNGKIDALQIQYDSKKNKDTKVANDILRRIERMKRLRDEVDADYTKRINDNREKVEKYKAKVDEGYDETEGRAMRSDVHAAKIDEIKAKFTENGLDFDETLKNAKNLSTFATVDNTPQRVMEKSLGYKEGQILADATVNNVAQNETDGIKWLNTITSRKGKGGLLKQLSDKYHIKPGSKESAAAQMYAEGFYVKDNGDAITYGDAELAKDFPDVQTQKNIKGLACDPRIRQFYDETLAKINESRARNAYPEIKPLDNYYLHFRAMDDTFSRLGIPFNPNDIRAKDLPTDLNGITADLKPGQPYFASAMHRRGQKTSHDLLGGIERYATGAKNQIYHIDDIQTLRALRNYIADTYGQANGLEGLDALDEDVAQERIKQVFNSHLSTFAKFLNEEANVIAGKTALIDRGLEGIVGRRGMTFLDTVNKQVGANMVGMNVSSSLTNFLAGVQAIAKTNKFACVKAFAQTVSSKIGSIYGKTDSFVENNPTIVRRNGADRFYRTPFQKVGDAGYVLMSAVDNVTTEFIVRAKYNEYIKNGMSEDQAITEADKWTSRLMADRSLGQMPQLYNSKTLGVITKFQLEVRNQLDSQFYDTIQETKASNEDIKDGLERNAKTAAKVTATFVELAVLQHLFGKAFESVAGYNPAFDIIDVLIKTFGFDDDEDDEDTVLDNVEEGFLALLEDLPYTSTFTGGRIPISAALPIKELVTGKDEYGNDKSRLETLGEVAPYYVLPTGYGQIKKTVQGLGMFDEDLPVSGSYTDSGNLRFPVEDTPGNRVQAALFGQWASENAREYFDNDYAPLNKKQIQEYIDVDLPIKEYREYREGLSDYDTLDEKADYIASLDLPISKKNLLVNNLTDRKDEIDLTEYDKYGNFDELDFAHDHEDVYKFLKDNNITYKQYVSFDKDTKEAYTWAAKNPEKYTLSKAIASDVVTYRRYTSELYDIRADKDENGKSISGSRKEKVIAYINNLDADYGEKIILFKNQYKADDTYNYDIVEYLNSREDISYEEMVAILKELGFTVSANGNVTWEE